MSKLTSAVQFLVDPCVEARRFFIDFLCLSPSWFLIIMIKSVRKRIIPGMTELKNNKIATKVPARTITTKTVTVNSAKSY
uniref:ATP synthase F0 subunit 8 n=1 Tax=Acrobeloides nanus TaxID=290746 RepID=A0A914BVU9_9BILA